jgi:hypothetical protein
MQSAAAEVVAVAAAATGWTGSPLIVACAGDNQGAGQVFDTSDSFGRVGKITSGPHRGVLQEVTSSPDITPEKTTKLKMSRFLCYSLSFSVTLVSSAVWESGVSSKRRLERLPNLNGCLTAKETTMKRFLKSVFTVLRKKNEVKSANARKQPIPTPALEVRP